MNNTEFKINLINALKSTQSYFRRVNDREYRLRCPLCGDSVDTHKAHMYMAIDLDNNTDIVYICFKCGRSGILTEELLKLFGITDNMLIDGCNTLSKTSIKLDTKGINNNTIIDFNYKLPIIKEKSIKTKYIEDRLGIKISIEDLNKIKLIPSIKEFLRLNDIHDEYFPSDTINTLDKKYVGFLSKGSSHILFRDISGKEKYKWIKFAINKNSNKNKIFYVMKSSIDIFTKDTIEINLSEGIMDILSAAFNLNHIGNNVLNIAVSSKGYVPIIMYIIDLGIVGDNVIINIFADNDDTFNKNSKNNTNIEFFKNKFEKIKYLFKDINVFYNTINKDIGVPRNMISLKKYSI